MQQRGYITLRTTKKRGSPQGFLNYIATASSSASNTAEVIQDLWAIPKANFVEGELPEELSANMPRPSECDGLIVDHDAFYVVGMCVLRSKCGRNVFRTQRTVYNNQSGYTSGSDVPIPVFPAAAGSTAPTASARLMTASAQDQLMTASASTASASDQLALVTADASEDPPNRAAALGFTEAIVAVPVSRPLKRHCSIAAAARAPEFSSPSSSVSLAERRRTDQGDTLRAL